MRKIPTGALVLFCYAALSVAVAQNNPAKPKSDHGQRAQNGTNLFNVAVPAHNLDLILARPENHSVTLSALADREMEACVIYGTQSGTGTEQTLLVQMKNGVPVEFKLAPLKTDTRYYCRLHWRPAGATGFTDSTELFFHTARSPGSTFTFTMTADVHLDEHTSAEVYQQSLANIRADAPDFHIDIGNLFMTDKHATRTEAARQYLAQRYYLSQTGSPLFLALGVHDGEASRYDDGSPDNLAAWANAIRKKYFPNPMPDTFYSGDSISKPPNGLLENYFAWTWGDALFVVLDPYRYSLHSGGRNNDGWAWSLGREQYEWLAKTLESSPAKYKFIFIHNLLAGDQASRGGVEIAGFNEWGGKNLDGTDGFAQHRPGWPLPVHKLLLQNHVTAVFRAHDNFYARQELDGILYLMVPQPSFAGNDRIRDLQTYGYKQGTFLGNSGHVRVTVSPANVKVEYIKATPGRTVADRCLLPGR